MVQYAVPRRGLPSPASFHRWALGFQGIVLRIVGEREGYALSNKYRRKKTPTNVLSFPYGKGRGDIVLCHPVIAREARAQGKTLAAHYAHLVVHGILHLRGYDHEKTRDAKRMEAREVRLLRRLGFPDPYAVKSPPPR
ncbi:MAG TPA: rRNA maturation RNase YbeY [Burkholderiales bacterium]